MTEPRADRTNRTGLFIAAATVAVVAFVIATSEWSRRTASTPEPVEIKTATTANPSPIAPSKAVATQIKPSVATTKPPGPTPAGMVWVPGGVYFRGSDSPTHHDARPWHAVEISGFWMDETTVTNEQFAQFAAATNYKTVAERTPKQEDYPTAKPSDLVAGSAVFTPPKDAVPLDNHYVWWKYVRGANWRRPEGPESDLKGRERHPVVHIAYEDAIAYAKWAGKRLPTEAEYEFAARGGLDRKRYAWGDDLMPGGKWMTNIWQGRFPVRNNQVDGYRHTAPVKTYPANGFGLCDMSGNVWQWCSDWYRDDYYQILARSHQPVKDPQGPNDSFDPSEPGVAKRVTRGGSFLCSDEYCTAYEVGVRGKSAPDTGTNHQGFRCAKSP